MSTDQTTRIHPTAVVEEGASLAAGCVILAHAVVTRYCDLDEGVVVHPGAVIGGVPQDLSFDSARETRVRIGARTVIREHVTVNRATRPGASTVVGADCFLMAASHVAHDCQVGNRVVMANAVLLGGHVQVGDRAFVGGGAVVHQFCRVGEDVMIGGGSRMSRDIPPFCMAAERNLLIGLNLVGLRRRGMKRDVLQEIKRAFRTLDVAVGNLRELAAAALATGVWVSEESRRFLEFYLEGKRQVVRTRRSGGGDDGSD